jgi:ubiquinone biosynthesis protein
MFALILRLLDIALRITGHGGALIAELALSSGSRLAATRQARAGKRIAMMLEDLGVIFVKVGQLASMRPDLLSGPLTEQLARLQDRLRPVPAAEIRREITRALGRPVDQLFASFDDQPVASASVSQVHRAVLRDGRLVAVKVRRPDVTRLVALDIALMEGLAGLASRMRGMAELPIEGLLREWCATVVDQLDFRKEAANHQKFRARVARPGKIIIPEVYEEFSSEAVITMEYIPGLSKLAPDTYSAAERSEAAALAIDTVYELIFDAGLVHADLHGGNIFFLPGNRVVLLDFGFVATLRADDQRRFKDFFHGIAANDGAGCARILLESATARRPWFDEGAFQASVQRLIAEFSAKKAGEFEVSAFAARLFDLQRRLGLVGATQFTMAIVSFLVFEGIVKQLDRDVDFLALALARMARRSMPSFFSAANAAAFFQGGLAARPRMPAVG